VVLVVDTVGELGTLYAAAQAVLVGGSLVPFGGHNVIEPAALGLPVLVGPHHDNFAGIVASFRARGALTVVRDAGELAVAVGALRAHPAACRAQGARALRTAQENSGASVRTLAALRGLVESVDATRSRAAEHRSGRMLEALPQLLNAAETAAPEVPPARSR
jgi:3-deoxy-D-manno-octulosonic-acid transferase